MDNDNEPLAYQPTRATFGAADLARETGTPDLGAIARYANGPDRSPTKAEIRAFERQVRRLPSRAEVLAYREQVEAAGVPFELRRTLPDFTARVRRLSLTDRAAIGSLPEAMQGRVVQLLNATRKQGGGDKPLTINRLLGNVERQEALGNVFCLHGFIEPRLVETEAEIADDATWLVTDVHVEDRIAFLNWCLGQDEDGAGRIKNFPDESGSDLGGLSPNGRNA